MIGGCEGSGEELGGVVQRAVVHSHFESKIAVVSLPRKNADQSGKVNYTLARNQMVVGLAEVVVKVSGEQTRTPATQEVEGLAGDELVVAGIVT